MQVFDKSFDVMVKDFGVIKRIYCEVTLIVIPVILKQVNFTLYYFRNCVLSSTVMRKKEKQKCPALLCFGRVRSQTLNRCV